MTGTSLAATLNLDLVVAGCDELTFSVEDLAPGSTIEAPLPGCKVHFTAAFDQVRPADQPDAEPAWQATFILTDASGRNRSSAPVVLAQPTMIAHSNERAEFDSGSYEQGTVTVHRPDGTTESLPNDAIRGVALKWTVRDT